MKNIIAGILTLLFSAILAVISWESLQAAHARDFLEDFELLTLVFVTVLGVYLLIDGFRGRAAAAERHTIPMPAVPGAAGAAGADSSVLVVAFLSLLQEKGRLLDFVMDDIAPYSDEQVGQVARVVHSGLRDALKDTMVISPLHEGQEGDVVSVEPNLSTAQYRFVGDLTRKPPFSGRVLHRGWKAKKISLPYTAGSIQENSDIVQPVEIEVR